MSFGDQISLTTLQHQLQSKDLIPCNHVCTMNERGELVPVCNSFKPQIRSDPPKQDKNLPTLLIFGIAIFTFSALLLSRK